MVIVSRLGNFVYLRSVHGQQGAGVFLNDIGFGGR